MSVRMIDIAREAGVSQASVSRVVNNSPDVSEEVAATVRAAMERLGYNPQPRRARNAMSNGGDEEETQLGGLIALLHFDDHHMGHADVLAAALRGIETSLADQEMGLVVVRANDPQRLPACLFNGQVKGLLLDGVSPRPEVWRRVRSLPHVWLSSYHDEGGDHALMGNEVIGRMAARYLIERGHRKIAFLSVKNRLPAFRARGEGFRYAAEQHGIEVQMIPAVEDTEEVPALMSLSEIEERALPLVDELLGARQRATGVFIPYDPTTAVVYRLLRKRGIEPSPELDIVSCGNQSSCLAGLTPRPATIDVGSELSGRQAVEQLLWKIAHPHQESRMRLSVDPLLIEGEIPCSTMREPDGRLAVRS